MERGSVDGSAVSAATSMAQSEVSSLGMSSVGGYVGAPRGRVPWRLSLPASLPSSRRARARMAMVPLSVAMFLCSVSFIRTANVSFESSSAAQRPGGVRSVERREAPLLAAPTSTRRNLMGELSESHLDRYPFTNLADVDTPPGRNDTAFYWQVPRAGGTTLRHILGQCLDLVQASRVGKDHCDVLTNELELCKTRFGTFVNADPSDDPGIRRARDLGLVHSGMADVVVSSRFLHATSLFERAVDGVPVGGAGRAFTILRHPVERSASTFYYLREATWERNYNPEFKSMSLMEWTRRLDTATNWMVRWLTGKNHEAKLTQADLDFAKALLKRKFLVLRTDDLTTGVERLVRYMGWDASKTGKKCAARSAAKVMARNRGTHHHDVLEGTEEYKALAEMNKMDIELYNYALELYEEQKNVVGLRDASPEDGGAVVPPAMEWIAASFLSDTGAEERVEDPKEKQLIKTIPGIADASTESVSGALPVPPQMEVLANKYEERVREARQAAEQHVPEDQMGLGQKYEDMRAAAEEARRRLAPPDMEKIAQKFAGGTTNNRKTQTT